MVIINRNRELVLKFYKSINGIHKTKKLLSHFTSDPALIEQFLFLENVFPLFKIIPEEMTTENDRVIVKASFTGNYTGEVNNISSTTKTINAIFATGYKIENNKIVNHWFITNLMELLSQFGITKQQQTPRNL